MKGSSPHARGAPRRARATTCCSRDHPRMRGEHSNREHLSGIDEGIIPACAGSTMTPSDVMPCRVGSSPHARGALEYEYKALPFGEDHPRMRGEHRQHHKRRNRARWIIPACAGSTPASIGAGVSCIGSSPHARGARLATSAARWRLGDHPRMRGEH